MDTDFPAVPFRGIHYDLPADTSLIAGDFQDIRKTGANAVLTGMLHSEALYDLADSLGLSLFQQLPLVELPAGPLAWEAAQMAEQISRIARMSASHPSVRHLGLAGRSDTSDEETCHVLSALGDAARRQSDGRLKLFYTTAFIEQDVCSEQVDMVLIDFQEDLPVGTQTDRWRTMHSTPVGVSGLGAWVDDGLPSGYLVPHSRDYQGRFLEMQLNSMLSENQGGFAAIFVDRWRDTAREQPDLTGDDSRPLVRASGLISASGDQRPALEVVRGIFTGRQTVFAFPAGDQSTTGESAGFRWLVWVLLGVLAVIVRASVNMRHLTRRYFQAHGIYLETVSFGRNIEFGPHALGLLLLSLSAGVAAGILFTVAHVHPAFNLLLRQFGGWPQQLIVTMAQNPMVLLLSSAAVYGLVLLGWTLLLTVISGIRSRHALTQRLVLVVWPRWTMLVIMFGAVVADTFSNPMRERAILLLSAIWLMAALWSVIRMTSDGTRALGGRPVLAFALAVGIPLTLTIGAALLLAQGSGLPYLSFAWHLLVRS